MWWFVLDYFVNVICIVLVCILYYDVFSGVDGMVLFIVLSFWSCFRIFLCGLLRVSLFCFSVIRWFVNLIRFIWWVLIIIVVFGLLNDCSWVISCCLDVRFKWLEGLLRNNMWGLCSRMCVNVIVCFWFLDRKCLFFLIWRL